MSHWGYVIEQLITEDEKMQVARAHKRKQRAAAKAARHQPPNDPSGSRPSGRRRITWARLVPRH